MRCFMKAIAIAACLFAEPSLACAETSFRMLSVVAGHRAKPLDVLLVYPSETDGRPTRLGANILFTGVALRQNATASAGRHGLVLLSHGSGGNALTMSWLSKALAEQGYIVAAPNHPGTMTGDSRQADTLRLWERPADLSAILDTLLADPVWAPLIDASHIAAIGFSLGGHTALASVGARVSAAAYAAYCDAPQPAGPIVSDCAWFAQGGVDLHRLERPRFEASMRDRRITAAVALDPGFTWAFTTESLAAIEVPVSVVSLGARGKVAHPTDPSPMIAARPGLPVAYVEDAIHFSALGECRANGKQILIEGGEVDPICDDGGSVPRSELHRRIAAAIVEALRRE